MIISSDTERGDGCDLCSLVTAPPQKSLQLFRDGTASEPSALSPPWGDCETLIKKQSITHTHRVTGGCHGTSPWMEEPHPHPPKALIAGCGCGRGRGGERDVALPLKVTPERPIKGTYLGGKKYKNDVFSSQFCILRAGTQKLME